MKRCGEHSTQLDLFPQRVTHFQPDDGSQSGLNHELESLRYCHFSRYRRTWYRNRRTFSQFFTGCLGPWHSVSFKLTYSSLSVFTGSSEEGKKRILNSMMMLWLPHETTSFFPEGILGNPEDSWRSIAKDAGRLYGSGWKLKFLVSI